MGMFDGIAGAALGGITNLVGGVLSNNQQTAQAAQANAFSAQQSQAQMDFQKQMRATQYQTAVEDLKSAGLNPMLAYTQGGAGTPSGSAATGQQATIHNPTSGLASSAMQVANIKADLELKDAQTTNQVAQTTATEGQAKKLDAETAAIVMGMPNIPQELKNKIAIEKLTEAQSGVAHATEANTRLNTLIGRTGDLPEAINKGAYHKNAPYNPNYIKDIAQGVSSASQAVGAAKGTPLIPNQYQQRR
jgi:hypothetical protein